MCGRSPKINEIVSLPDSSVVEQLAVNQLAVGSNPTPGAKKIFGYEISKDFFMHAKRVEPFVR